MDIWQKKTILSLGLKDSKSLILIFCEHRKAFRQFRRRNNFGAWTMQARVSYTSQIHSKISCCTIKFGKEASSLLAKLVSSQLGAHIFTNKTSTWNREPVIITHWPQGFDINLLQQTVWSDIFKCVCLWGYFEKGSKERCCWFCHWSVLSFCPQTMNHNLCWMKKNNHHSTNSCCY